MRKVENGQVMEFNEIRSKYTHDFCVVEIISVDPSKGEEWGKILWIFDNLEDALDKSILLDGVNSMVIPGVAFYNVIGMCFV